MHQVELTKTEIEFLLNGIIDDNKEVQSFELCPKCSIKTKRLFVSQSARRETHLRIIDESDRMIYKGEIHSGICFCFKCKNTWIA